uniref:G-protein coupled receptors family 1 profile domain-containing protein n=1 Tax=Biomphalaria glabrata TaxID=6526 RepID=A0A2C9L8S1_BIOGL
MMNQTSPDVTCFTGDITDGLVEIYFTVNFFALNAIIGSVGLVVNIIKVIVFFKLGLNDSTNISFFVLSLADAAIGLLMVGFSVVFNPLFQQTISNIDVEFAISYYCVSWPYSVFSRVAALMTAVITVERFLCITFPLKVKEIMNPTITAITSITLTFLVLATVIPAFVATHLGPVFNEKLNETILGLVQTEYRVQLETFSYFFLAFFQIMSIVVITVLTTALTHRFLQITSWRNQVSNKSGELSGKDKRLVKMVILLSISFLLFSIPAIVFIFFAEFQAGFTITGACKNLYFIFSSFIFPTDAMNSIVSFFLLVHMSSKFQHVVNVMLRVVMRGKKNKRQTEE